MQAAPNAPMTSIPPIHGDAGLFESASESEDSATSPVTGAADPTAPNGSITPPPGFWYLAPPPELQYPGCDEAINAMHEWDKHHGFDVSRQKPMKNKDGEIYKYLYRCTKHGKLDNNRKLTEDTRKRKVHSHALASPSISLTFFQRKSGKIGCPMGIYVKAVDPSNPSGAWCIVHQQNGRSNFHNHEAVDGLELTGHRRRERTEELKALIRQQRAAGMDANQTLSFLKEQNPNALVTRQDILNYRRADPGPISDHTVYNDKPYLLCISFLQDFETDELYGDALLKKLRHRLPVSVCSKPDMLSRHFSKNPPRAILVADQALTYPEYRLALARVVTYNQDGGTVIFLGHFAHNTPEYINQMFLHHYNLDWESTHPGSSVENLNQSSVKMNEHFASGTHGRYIVLAKNFAPGTDVAAIEALIALVSNAQLVSCRLYSQNPFVTAELVFSTQEGAKNVIETFDGKSVNIGRVSTLEGKELQFILRNPSLINVQGLAPTPFVKANFLQKVPLENIVYQYAYQPVYNAWGQQPMLQPEQMPPLAAAAYCKVGKGWLGYIGLMEGGDNMAKLLFAMCHF